MTENNKILNASRDD